MKSRKSCSATFCRVLGKTLHGLLAALHASLAKSTPKLLCHGWISSASTVHYDGLRNTKFHNYTACQTSTVSDNSTLQVPKAIIIRAGPRKYVIARHSRFNWPGQNSKFLVRLYTEWMRARSFLNVLYRKRDSLPRKLTSRFCGAHRHYGMISSPNEGHIQ